MEYKYDPFEDLGPLREEFYGEVLVACVHEDVSGIVSAFESMRDPVRVHLLHYRFRARSRSEDLDKVYSRITAELEAARSRMGRSVEIMIHRDYDPNFFETSVSFLNGLLHEETQACHLVHVCITGPETFAAAAGLVVPRFRNATLRVPVSSGYRTFFERARALEDGTFEGRFSHPAMWHVGSLPREPVDLPLLAAFKVYCSIRREERTNAVVFRNLVRFGLTPRSISEMECDEVPQIPRWDPDSEEQATFVERTSVAFENFSDPEWFEEPRFVEGNGIGDEEQYRKLQKSESVMLARYLLDRWEALGWIEGGRRDSVERVRTRGRNMLKMFLPDSVFCIECGDIVPNRFWRDHTTVEPRDYSESHDPYRQGVRRD